MLNEIRHTNISYFLSYVEAEGGKEDMKLKGGFYGCGKGMWRGKKMG